MAEVDATRTCVVCGVLFPRDGKTLMCSPECVAARYREYQRRDGRVKGPQQLTCKHCQQPFIGVASKVYCSVKCKDAERRTTQAWAETVKRKKLKPRKSTAGIDRRRGDRAAECLRYRAKNLERVRERERRRERHRPSSIAAAYRSHIAAAMQLNATASKAIARAARKAERAAEFALKPWLAMNSADAWKFRYRNDPLFRQAQIQRLKKQKLKRKKQELHGLTKAEALAVYAERSSCLYCGCHLGPRAKVLDHMDPLSKGGAHDASNLVVACRGCNTRKAAKEFIKWLPLVAEARRKLVADWYARKHGAQPEQRGLLLLMAA